MSPKKIEVGSWEVLTKGSDVLILAVGSIEDCGGHCMGNDNWTMFFICLTIMIISGILTLYTMKGNQ